MSDHEADKNDAGDRHDDLFPIAESHNSAGLLVVNATDRSVACPVSAQDEPAVANFSIGRLLFYGYVRMDHLRRIDDAVEQLLGREAESSG